MRETTFGEVLRSYRECSGLTRNDFAALVDLDGSYIHRLERGSRRPSRKTVIAMAAAMELDEETLNKWLLAAGHGPLPLSSPSGSGVRARKCSLSAPKKGVSHTTNAALRGATLESLGVRYPTLSRLVLAAEAASVRERKRSASIISGALHSVIQNLENPIKTAVIPAAGGSHRLVAHHVMQRLLIRAIREAAESGIQDIVLVLAPEMEQHFYAPLKALLSVAGPNIVNLLRCIQPQPNGLGDAVLCAGKLIDDRPFAVVLPDDILSARVGHKADPNELSLMIDALSKNPDAHIIAGAEVSRRRMARYGVAEIAMNSSSALSPVSKLVEKPKETDPILNSSNAVGIVGRYLFQPSIISALHKLSKRGQKPIELTTAIEIVRAKGEKVFMSLLSSTRRDFGDVVGEASAVVESAPE